MRFLLSAMITTPSRRAIAPAWIYAHHDRRLVAIYDTGSSFVRPVRGESYQTFQRISLRNLLPYAEFWAGVVLSSEDTLPINALTSDQINHPDLTMMEYPAPRDP